MKNIYTLLFCATLLFTGNAFAADLINVATITANNGDTATATSTVSLAPAGNQVILPTDVSLQKRVNNPNPDLGERVDFTILMDVVTRDIGQAVLVDTFDSEFFEIDPGSISLSECYADVSRIKCDFDNLDQGDNITLEYSLIALKTGDTSNSVVLTDVDGKIVSDTVNITITEPTILLTKRASNPQPYINEPVDFTVDFEILDGNIDRLTLLDDFDEDYFEIDAQSVEPADICTIDASDILCEFLNPIIGQTYQLSYTLTPIKLGKTNNSASLTDKNGRTFKDVLRLNILESAIAGITNDADGNTLNHFPARIAGGQDDIIFYNNGSIKVGDSFQVGFSSGEDTETTEEETTTEEASSTTFLDLGNDETDTETTTTQTQNAAQLNSDFFGENNKLVFEAPEPVFWYLERGDLFEAAYFETWEGCRDLVSYDFCSDATAHQQMVDLFGYNQDTPCQTFQHGMLCENASTVAFAAKDSKGTSLVRVADTSGNHTILTLHALDPAIESIDIRGEDGEVIGTTVEIPQAHTVRFTADTATQDDSINPGQEGTLIWEFSYNGSPFIQNSAAGNIAGGVLEPLNTGSYAIRARKNQHIGMPGQEMLSFTNREIISEVVTVQIGDPVPYIDSLRTAGNAGFAQGTNDTLYLRLRHFGTVSDIADIELNLVRGQYLSAEDIPADAEYFAINLVPEDILTEAAADKTVLLEIPFFIPLLDDIKDGPHTIQVIVNNANGEVSPSVVEGVHPLFIGIPQKGDVDLDGEITLLDAVWSLRFIEGTASPSILQLETLDVNQDDNITFADYFQQFLAFLRSFIS